MCETSKKCIDDKNVCDNIDHCNDKSDESEKCLQVRLLPYCSVTFYIQYNAIQYKQHLYKNQTIPVYRKKCLAMRLFLMFLQNMITNSTKSPS